jgi:23S rRNA G2445 N2-methylase RlmL
MTEQTPIRNRITLTLEERKLLDPRQRGIYQAVEQFKKHAFLLEITAGEVRARGHHQLADERERAALAVREAVQEVVTMLRAELLRKTQT